MTSTQPESPLQLYSFALSGHCHRVALMCSLLGISVELREVNLAKADHQTPEFLHLNPLGQVPVLIDAGTVIADSNAALVYLACQYDSQRTWYPTTPLAASRVQRWLSLAAGEVASGPAAARAAQIFKRPPNERAPAIAERLFTWMDRELTHSLFACGTTPTIADVAMYTYCAHAPEGGISLEPYAAVRAWLSRVEALPGFIGMKRSPTPPHDADA
jgi:glutathione S-transferase